MITDQMTKSQFVVEVLNRDFANIYRAQLLIAEKNIRIEGRSLKQKKGSGKTIGTRSGRLLESLRNPDYSIRLNHEQVVSESNIPLYIRFLDMNKKGNWMIYNRQIWGILYNNSLIDIKYRYGQQIYNFVGAALADALASSFNSGSKRKSSDSSGMSKHEQSLARIKELKAMGW